VQVPAGQSPPSPEVAGAAACSQLLGPRFRVDPRRLRRRGLFHFEERDATHGAAVALGERYSEHQLVLRLNPEEEAAHGFEPQATETFEPMGWFAPGEIPYDMMPEDDKVWYERVLFGDQRLRGTFAFEGTRLVEHALEEVTPEEGLCDLDKDCVSASSSYPERSDVNSAQPALLLHNPGCSKSRALHEALTSRGVHVVERHYLEDPLTLSELETLAARLSVAAAPSSTVSAAKDLCRDEELASSSSEEMVLEALALRPELLQRPVLIRGRRAAFGRPQPEDAMRIL
ncbi:unnamed protein product, partial [Polarella glacialis]